MSDVSIAIRTAGSTAAKFALLRRRLAPLLSPVKSFRARYEAQSRASRVAQQRRRAPYLEKAAMSREMHRL